MKKDNPLVAAISARSKQPEQNTVSIPSKNVPRETNVGDEICITGTLRSMTAGVAVIAVTSVENETQGEDDGQEETKTSQVLRVQTQESNVGGM